MAMVSSSQGAVDLNYFVCTLGQATAINEKNPHSYNTINEFIDYQASYHPDFPAVGFPVPSQHESPDGNWDYRVYSTWIFAHRCETSIITSQSAFEILRRKCIFRASLFAHHIQEQTCTTRQRTVAFLCPSSEDFLVGWLALMRLGYAVLLIAYVGLFFLST